MCTWKKMMVGMMLGTMAGTAGAAELQLQLGSQVVPDPDFGLVSEESSISMFGLRAARPLKPGAKLSWVAGYEYGRRERTGNEEVTGDGDVYYGDGEDGYSELTTRLALHGLEAGARWGVPVGRRLMPYVALSGRAYLGHLIVRDSLTGWSQPDPDDPSGQTELYEVKPSRDFGFSGGVQATFGVSILARGRAPKRAQLSSGVDTARVPCDGYVDTLSVANRPLGGAAASSGSQGSSMPGANTDGTGVPSGSPADASPDAGPPAAAPMNPAEAAPSGGNAAPPAAPSASTGHDSGETTGLAGETPTPAVAAPGGPAAAPAPVTPPPGAAPAAPETPGRSPAGRLEPQRSRLVWGANLEVGYSLLSDLYFLRAGALDMGGVRVQGGLLVMF